MPFLVGPYNKNFSILGLKLGSPHFGKVPYQFCLRKFKQSGAETAKSRYFGKVGL